MFFKLDNVTGYGWASLRADVLIVLAIAVVAWRVLIEGDSFDDAAVWVGGAIAAVVAVVDNIRRSKEGVATGGNDE